MALRRRGERLGFERKDTRVLERCLPVTDASQVRGIRRKGHEIADAALSNEERGIPPLAGWSNQPRAALAAEDYLAAGRVEKWQRVLEVKFISRFTRDGPLR